MYVYTKMTGVSTIDKIAYRLGVLGLNFH